VRWADVAAEFDRVRAELRAVLEAVLGRRGGARSAVALKRP
jgi:hypothetical protein